MAAGTLPDAVADIAARAAMLQDIEGESEDYRRIRAFRVLAAALGVALARQGVGVTAALGEHRDAGLR